MSEENEFSDIDAPDIGVPDEVTANQSPEEAIPDPEVPVDETFYKLMAPELPPRDPPTVNIPSGGPLFTPDNDPLLEKLEHQLPVPPVVMGQRISSRLRHLICEQPPRTFPDPSGRRRPRDRY